MALIDLGTQPLVIGATPVLFTPFAYDFTQAYLIGGTFTASTFNSIFSNVRVDVIISPAPNLLFYHPEPTILTIRPGLLSFFVPMSQLFLASGTATIQAERLPFVRGGADSPTTITLNLFYEDTVSVPSWRD